MIEFADDNSKFDENGRKIFKGIENTVGKGEIARYEQFLLFPHCFKRLVLQTCKNQGLFGKRLTFTTKSWIFTTSRERIFENIVGKEENAGYQHFPISHDIFKPFIENVC